MNYVLRHKYIFLLGALCMIGIIVYTILNASNILFDEAFLLTQSASKSLPKKLRTFNLEKRTKWQPYPIKGDLFDSPSLSITAPFNSKEDSEKISDNSLRPPSPHIIRLDGWANIRGEMVFVFFSENLQTSFLGRVGDSFESPAFTILSYDLKNLENYSNKGVIPLVTILNQELNEKVILTPNSYTEI